MKWHAPECFGATERHLPNMRWPWRVETELTDEIEALYRRYRTAWKGRDFAGVAACFAEPAFHVLPAAEVPLPDRATFAALLEKVFAGRGPFRLPESRVSMNFWTAQGQRELYRQEKLSADPDLTSPFLFRPPLQGSAHQGPPHTLDWTSKRT